MAPPTSSPTSAAAPQPTQSSVVPVDDEPLHQQRWKTADVRLVDVQFPPHTESLWHQHVHYGVYIAITPLRAIEQSTEATASKPLAKHRGDVFCRDHTMDRLTHVVKTTDEPMRIIEVELLRDDRHLSSSAQLPLHTHRSVVLVHDDNRCRVYRLTLLRGVDGADSVTLVLPTNAVLVAIHDATIGLQNANVDKKIHVDHARELPSETRSFTPGDDAQLVAGKVTIQGVKYDETGVAVFILTEVY